MSHSHTSSGITLIHPGFFWALQLLLKIKIKTKQKQKKQNVDSSSCSDFLFFGDQNKKSLRLKSFLSIYGCYLVHMEQFWCTYHLDGHQLILLDLKPCWKCSRGQGKWPLPSSWQQLSLSLECSYWYKVLNLFDIYSRFIVLTMAALVFEMSPVMTSAICIVISYHTMHPKF